MIDYERRPPGFLLGGWRMGFPGYPPTLHHHAELIYVVRGELRVTVDGETFTIQTGQLFVLFSYLVHSYQPSPDTQYILLLFDPSVTPFRKTLLHQKPVCPVIDGTAFAPILERSVTFLNNNNKYKTATAYLNAVLGEFLEIVTLDPVQRNTNSMNAKILEYCADHFAEPISLKRIADALSVSQNSVSKLFSDRLHYSFRDYINDLRIEQAKTLLRETNQHITDVMFACGFANQSTFNRVFLSTCGCSPREYRQQLNSLDKPSNSYLR